MQKIVHESELGSVNIREFHRILLTTNAANAAGIEIKPDRRMPAFVSADSPAPDVVTNELIIVAEDAETTNGVERLRRYITEQLKDA